MDPDRAKAALDALPQLDIARIEAILVDCLGETDGQQNPLPGCELVDVFVMQFPYKTDKVHEHAAEMIELLKSWPHVVQYEVVPPLGDEINYLIAGAVLADQRRALMLFAFGKLLDWWDILDPHTVLGLAKDDAMALEMAAMGMVSIMGFRPSVPA